MTAVSASRCLKASAVSSSSGCQHPMPFVTPTLPAYLTCQHA